MKKYQITNINPKEKLMYNALGITDERNEELIKKLQDYTDKLGDQQLTDPEDQQHNPEKYSAIAYLKGAIDAVDPQTDIEFAYICFRIGEQFGLRRQ